MNILIDTLCCGNQLYGVSRVLLEHLKRLTGPEYPRLEIHLIVSPDNKRIFDVPGTHPVEFPFDLRRRGLSLPLQMAWERFSLPGIIGKLGIDVFYRPNLAWYQPLPCPQVANIHDLAEFHPRGGMQYSRLRRVYRRRAVARTAAGADKVITSTEYSAREILERFPEAAGRMEIVFHGPPKAEPRETGAPGEPCFLAVGKQLRHKNFMTLCRSYIAADRSSPLKAPLVFLGGAGNATEEMKAYVQAQGYDGRIVFRGYVTDQERKDYHRRALAFLLSSYYEGFGLPILEAMAQGVPVVSSNGSCLPEVAGDAAMLVDPASEGDWAKAMADIDAGRIDLDAMSRAGYANLKRFSWEESARKLAGILETAAGKSRDGSPMGASAPAGNSAEKGDGWKPRRP